MSHSQSEISLEKEQHFSFPEHLAAQSELPAASEAARLGRWYTDKSDIICGVIDPGFTN